MKGIWLRIVTCQPDVITVREIVTPGKNAPALNMLNVVKKDM